MRRADELRACLARCEQRARVCQREFSKLCRLADLSQPEQQRQHMRLKAELERALRDCEWAREQLGRAWGR
jgi:hypothetical protein